MKLAARGACALCLLASAAASAVDAGLRQRYVDAGQGHIFAFEDSFTPDQAALFNRDLSEFKPEELAGIYSRAMAADKAGSSAASGGLATGGGKYTAFPASDIVKSSELDESHLHDGLSLIADYGVAVVLLAGGQGSRLGSSDPKGMYDIGLPSHSSLFRLHAHRIARLEAMSAPKLEGEFHPRPTIPLYIMTSPATDAATRAYFREQDFFGLKPKQVRFFQQAMLPCFDGEGKLLLASQHSLAKAPNGHGGLIDAFNDYGILTDMDASGISHVFLFTVDNALALPADPSFVGFCASHAADVCFKVTPKVSPSESMGTVVMKSSGSKEEGAGPRGAHVLEYSDYDAAASAGLIEEGSEAGIHATGHLLMNLLSIDFLKRVVNDHIDELEYHVAHKKIATVGPDGLPFKPSTPNGIKLERFVFDAFPFASVVKAVEVQREEEFAPVKNPPGQGLPDSPDTARDLLLAHHTQLLSQAGVRTVVANGGEQDVGLVEISPLLSFSRGEQLREMFPTGELSKPDGRPFFVAHPSGRIVDKEENLIVQAHSSHGGDEL